MSLAVAVGLWLAVGVAAASSAPGSDNASSPYLRTRWELDQGFPGGAVSAIAQTADGYLWIGTEKGLVRFDGLSFQLVEQANPGFPPIGRVLGLVTDAAGDLWVRLQGARLLRYHDGRFEDVLNSVVRAESGFTAMSRSRSGTVLLCGLHVGIVQQKGTSFETLVAASELPRSVVIAIAQAADGTIWLGTRDAGLFSLRAGQPMAHLEGVPDPKINSLLPIDDRAVWIATDNGLARWDGTAVVKADAAASSAAEQTLAMIADRDATIWIGTSRGLSQVVTTGALPLREALLSGRPVTALFEDREGNVWVGDTGGVERFRSSPFRTYTSAQGLPSASAGPLYVDGRNRVWFAPPEGGLFTLRDTEVARAAADHLRDDVIYAIDGTANAVWIGRQRGGLTELRQTGGAPVVRTYTHADGLAQDSVYAVHTSRDGAVWAATLSAGLSRLENGRFTTFTTDSGLRSNTVTAIAEASDGTLWFATPNGLSTLSLDRWSSFTSSEGLPSDDVRCLAFDTGGVLWIGTAGGLAFLESRTVTVPAEAPASLKGPIVGVTDDGRGSLWVATSSRILRVRREALLRGGLTDRDVRDYGLADGLRSVETVRRQQSIVTDAAGRVWISTTLGLSTVDPARVTAVSAPALVRIESVSADGVAVDLRTRLRLPAEPQRVTFSYAGLSLSVPERVRYRYRLDGFDHEWSAPVSSREAVYTNLNPGPYYFRVIASNGDGLWNGTEAAIGFDIDPVFWQTPWFRLSAVGIVALAVLALYRVRMHQVSRQLTVRFEERLAERTRIAQELHDTLLQGFVSASMQLHVAADRLPEDSPVKAPLARVQQLMGQVIEEGRNAVRGLRSPSASPDDLAQAFSSIPGELSARDDVGYRVLVEGQPRPLNPVIRDEVYRIGREALMNAFRHSGATTIEVELEYAARHVRLLVRDDGKGIEPDVLKSGADGHWGLSGMRERADRIGARLKVFSRVSAGTEVELAIPSQIAFHTPKHEKDQREG